MLQNVNFCKLETPILIHIIMDSSTSQPIAMDVVHEAEEKDLGIWCTGDLKPSLQFQRAAAKAIQVLGLIRRYFKLSHLTHAYFFVATKCLCETTS